jgi:hypothetical protein
MVSELFRIAVRLDPEWCPDSIGMLSEMGRNSRFKEWSDAGAARVCRSAVGSRMKELNGFKKITMHQIKILRLKYQNQLSLRDRSQLRFGRQCRGDYVKREGPPPVAAARKHDEEELNSCLAAAGSSSVPTAAGLALHPPRTVTKA